MSRKQKKAAKAQRKKTKKAGKAFSGELHRPDRVFDLEAVVPEAAPVVEGGDRPDDLLERARAHWQMGDWPALAALWERPLDTHPDRARLALLAAVGSAQLGRMDEARRAARQAQLWGCERELLARVLIGGVHNSLGRVASLHEDEPRALRHFEASVATVSPRADAAVLGRARNIHEKARLGQLPEAAKLVGAAHDALRRENRLSDNQAKILASQIQILNHEMALMHKRRQLTRAGAQDGAESRLENRAVSQLGQDLWVLERTGRKRGGYFVEFGATDGIQLSNTFLLETEFGWTGLCAEPNPHYFEQLQQNRRCTVSSDCILGETGRDVEFVLADEFGSVVDFMDSDKHAERRAAFRNEGRVLRMTSISLDDFLEKHGAPRDIDYLSIDTEGSEYEILSHFPLDKWNIRLITVEHNFNADRGRIRDLLLGHGYRVTETEWDDWYEKDGSA